MKKSFIFFVAGLSIGVFLGHNVLSFWNGIVAAIDYPPSDKQSEFARACSELNNEKLTTQNLKKLGGWCWLGRDFTECGDEYISRLKNGTDPFFLVRQKKQFDNAWYCTISKNEDGTIKATTNYQYD